METIALLAPLPETDLASNDERILADRLKKGHLKLNAHYSILLISPWIPFHIIHICVPHQLAIAMVQNLEVSHVNDTHLAFHDLCKKKNWVGGVLLILINNRRL